MGVSLRKRRFWHEKNHPYQNHSTPYHRWNYAGIDEKNQASWAWSFLSIFSIKDNGNWPIIDQLNLHIRSKDTCLNGHFLR